jgi:hypothetical protein
MFINIAQDECDWVWEDAHIITFVRTNT